MLSRFLCLPAATKFLFIQRQVAKLARLSLQQHVFTFIKLYFFPPGSWTSNATRFYVEQKQSGACWSPPLQQVSGDQGLWFTLPTLISFLRFSSHSQTTCLIIKLPPVIYPSPDFILLHCLMGRNWFAMEVLRGRILVRSEDVEVLVLACTKEEDDKQNRATQNAQIMQEKNTEKSSAIRPFYQYIYCVSLQLCGGLLRLLCFCKSCHYILFSLFPHLHWNVFWFIHI